MAAIIDALATAKSEYAAALPRFQKAGLTELPAHQVMLTQPFYMGKYAVTQEQYEKILGTNPSSFKGSDNPVENVSWNDARLFCKRVSEQTKVTFLLPTEAQWEYACRAGTTSTYYSGETEKDLLRVAWFYPDSKNTTHPVGQKKPNAFGPYDMHGNVWQWCQDYWDENYYENSATENPSGPEQGIFRVMRGGSWFYWPNYCLSAYRNRFNPSTGSYDVGFRVVMIPEFRNH